MSTSPSSRSPLTGAPDTPVLDNDTLESLLALAGGDVNFLDSVFSVFFQTTPEQLKSMKTLLSASKWEELRRLSHTLRGSCATLGAPGFVAACTALEAACKQTDNDASNEAISALELEFQWIESELTAFKTKS
ncbi:MAG: Hpt domain-containing protein [Planctomycetota bacterium]|nr:Hpt domain-containing protein [Planctomycetota bacterium]